MKFKISKLIALTLCLSIIFSCALPSVNAVNGENQVISTLDFEDEAYAESILETKKLTADAMKNDYELISVDGNTVFKPTETDLQNSPVLTTFKDEVLPLKNLESFSFTVSLVNSGNKDNFVSFYSLYNEDTASAAGLSFTVWAERIYFRKNVNGEGINTTMEDGNLGELGYFNFDETLTVSVSYDYSDFANGNIFVDYTFVSDAVDENGQFKTDSISDIKYTVAGKGFPLAMLKPAFGSGMSGNTAYFDDVSITYSENAATKANIWYLTYEEVLSKSAADFDESTDLANWNAALSEYDALDSATKNLLYQKNAAQKLYKVRSITETQETSQYKADNAVALSLTRDNANPEHKTVIDNAINSYSALDALSRLLLASEYATLVDVSKYIIGYIPPKANDYDKTPINVNFEGGVNPFVNNNALYNDEYYYIKSDPVDPENNAFYAENYYNGLFLLDEKYYPSRCIPNVVSFKLFMKNYSPFARFSVMLSYFDEENYSCVQFETEVAHYKKVVNGVASQEHIWNLNWEDDGTRRLNWKDWVTVTLYYSDGGTVKVVASDNNDETVSGTAPFVPGGKFGFGYLGQYEIRGTSAYIDDVSLTFNEGDFDLNDNLSDIGIKVYYTGNNYVGQNETLFISGERLGKTVDKAYIMKLDDVKGDELSYVAQENAFTDGMDYYDPAYAVDPALKWDNSKATELEILQRSDLSLNAVIPADIGEGVYIVRLTSLLSGVSDKYIYVNAPYISFVNGDDGESATAGGTIRIVGHNLNTKYAEGENTGATLKLKNLETGEITTVSGAEIKGFGDNSALEANLPLSLAKGEYAVYVHSGIGDETAYSIPGYIKIAASIRDSWGLERIFNVRDTQFAGGAKGDGNTNDTPAFMEALAAAYEAGGGTVYVPAGSYRVLSTLPIPQNVHLKGEDNGNTMIFWTARRWDFNKLPDAHIRILGNCEISGIYFYGTRVNGFIDADDATDGNIYIHDIRTNFVWYAGAPTNGGGTGTTGRLTNMEISQLLMAEMQGEKTVFIDMSDEERTNIQLHDISLYNPRRTTREIVLEAKNSIVHNVDGLNNWIHFGGEALVVEECEISGCVGPNSNGLYFARNNNLGTGGNNKELMTTDGAPYQKGKSIQFIGDKPELMQKAGLSGTDNVTYKFTGIAPKDDIYIGKTISITSGQGLGQSRQIVWQKGQYFRVESPFVVTPNRNGTVSVTHPRISMQFINSTWKSGDAVGTYGSMVDGLFDGNTFADFGTQVYDNQGGTVWYITNENNKYTDPVYVHGDGAGITLHEDDIYSLACRFGGTENFGNIGFVYRSNDIEGYWFLLTFCTVQNALEGYILENNNLYDLNVKYAAFTLEIEESRYNNMLLRNNLFDVEKAYNETALAAMNTVKNKYGSFKLMTDYVLSEDEEDHLGDVNLDGKISLKDSTLVRLYFIGLTSLTAEQIKNGDVNDDGKLDLKDASQIRRYILTGEEFVSSKDDSWIDADY